MSLGSLTLPDNLRLTLLQWSLDNGCSLGSTFFTTFLRLAAPVGIPRFNASLESSGFGGQSLDGLLLLFQGGLHGVDHTQLFLLKLFDVSLGLFLHLEVHVGDVHGGHGGASVVIGLVLTHLAHHFLALGVHVACVLRFLGVFMKFLLEEVVIVRFEESIQIITGVQVVVEDLPLVVVNVNEVLLATLLVEHVLVINASLFLLSHHFVEVFVILFPGTGGVSQARVLVGNLDLLLETFLFDTELAHTVLNQELLHLLLLQE